MRHQQHLNFVTCRLPVKMSNERLKCCQIMTCSAEQNTKSYLQTFKAF